jgi:hypothetical protein
VAGSNIAVSGASGAVTISSIPGEYSTGNLTVTGTAKINDSFNPRARLFISNVQGTFSSPVVAGTQSNPLDITGTTGYIRIPFFDTVDGRQEYRGVVALSGPQARMIIQPSGQTNLRNTGNRIKMAVANISPVDALNPNNRLFAIFGFGFLNEDPIGVPPLFPLDLWW